MEGVLFRSTYFKIWYELTELGSKRHVITELRRFEKYLVNSGYEGELNFNKFHASRKHPGVFLPIQETFIDKFIKYLRIDCKASKYVLYNAVSSLKSFFRFLNDMDLIQHNPMEDYPNPYYDRPIKNTALSKDECLEVLQTAIKKDPFFRQEFLIIWFMLVTGLRNAEVRGLSWTNINFENKMVTINHEQKNNERTASITDALAKEIKRYVNHTNFIDWKNQGNDKLFYSCGIPLSPEKLCRIVKNLCKEAGITRTVTPHDLRRTSAYLMQTSGMNMVEIQRQLGHKIMATTLRYVPPIQELAEILKRTVK